MRGDESSTKADDQRRNLLFLRVHAFLLLHLTDIGGELIQGEILHGGEGVKRLAQGIDHPHILGKTLHLLLGQLHLGGWVAPLEIDRHFRRGRGNKREGGERLIPSAPGP